MRLVQRALGPNTAFIVCPLGLHCQPLGVVGSRDRGSASQLGTLAQCSASVTLARISQKAGQSVGQAVVSKGRTLTEIRAEARMRGLSKRPLENGLSAVRLEHERKRPKVELEWAQRRMLEAPAAPPSS